MFVFCAVMVLAVLAAAPAMAQDTGLSFFVTSRPPGDGGGDLGGLRGADAHCQALATEVGAGNKTWRAYLSLSHPALTINARDRIGNGPWYNAGGVMVASNVDDLHSDNANVTAQTALTETGDPVNQEGQRNRHDVFTGSRPDGSAWPYPMMDLLNFDGHALTCNNWTSDDENHLAMIGHHDRGGQVGYSSWNSAHPTAGCSPAGVQQFGGGGLFYCFATD
jgi:hypothetical protein